MEGRRVVGPMAPYLVSEELIRLLLLLSSWASHDISEPLAHISKTG